MEQLQVSSSGPTAQFELGSLDGTQMPTRKGGIGSSSPLTARSEAERATSPRSVGSGVPRITATENAAEQDEETRRKFALVYQVT